MADINYNDIKNLSMFDHEELLEDDVVLTLANVINANLTDKKDELTVNQVVDHLVSQRFYAPRIVSFGADKIGFFIAGSFRQITANLGLGMPTQANPTDPIRYDVELESETDKFTTSITVKNGTKPRVLMTITSELVSEGVVNQANLAKLIEMLEPQAVATIPDGDYEVASFRSADRSCQIKTTSGLLVTVNQSTPETVKNIRSINGVIYQVENGKPVRGISVTGQAVNIIPGENCEIDDTYTISGIVTNNNGKGDYNIALMAKSEEKSPYWAYVEGTVAALAIRRVTQGKVAMVKVAGVKAKTGNMKNDKPIFAPAK